MLVGSACRQRLSVVVSESIIVKQAGRKRAGARDAVHARMPGGSSQVLPGLAVLPLATCRDERGSTTRK